MKLDNEQQRTFLLEMLKTISIPGAHLEFVYALMVGLKSAEIECEETNNSERVAVAIRTALLDNIDPNGCLTE